VRPYQDDDLKWLWAAYRSGAFTEWLDADLSQADFAEKMLAYFMEIYARRGEVMIGLANFGSRPMSPVGLFRVDTFQGAFWPHVVWFPWATARNKLEVVVGFIQWLKEQGLVLISAEPKNIPFFSHVARYGLIRRVGTIKGRGKMALYQGVIT